MKLELFKIVSTVAWTVYVFFCSGLALAQDIDFGNYHALLIANQKYKFWSELRTPNQDIDALEKELKNHYNFEVITIRDVTRDQIIDELENLRVHLTDSDNLLIYYAGHGQLRSDGGYWIGVDATKDSRSRWLHYRTVSELLDTKYGMRARHILVVADSCYSGALFRGVDVAAKPKPGEGRAAWLARINRKRVRVAMTSGGTEPVIDSVGNEKYSIFARELLSKLHENGEVLEAQLLYIKIKEEVHARAQRLFGSKAQAPEYGYIPGTGHDGGDFLFVPKNNRIPIIITPPPTTGDSDTVLKGDEECRSIRADLELWKELTKNGKSYRREDYEAYLRKCPQGYFFERAKRQFKSF